MNFDIFSYIGLFLATIYRLPQIAKIIKTKKAEDISSYSYLTHNGVYVSFIVYLVGKGKTRSEWVLCLYYAVGMIQNFIIFGLKKYYAYLKANKEAADAQLEEGESLETARDG